MSGLRGLVLGLVVTVFLAVGTGNAAGLDGGFSQGFVSLDFDDGWYVTYQNALPILNSSGLKSTWYIITGSFGDPQYVNQTEVLIMQAMGHKGNPHTRTHPDLTLLSAAQIQDEVAGSRNDLLAIGVKPADSFDYPFGAYNSTVINAVKNAGYTSARTVDPGFIVKGDDPYLLKSMPIEVGTTFAQVKSWIDSAVRNKSGVKLVFHQIDHSGSQYSSAPEMLQQIVNYLVQQNVLVLTTSQIVALLATGNPNPNPNPEPVNLVKNPSFENFTDGFLDNWFTNSSRYVQIVTDSIGNMARIIGGRDERYICTLEIPVIAGKEYSLSFYQWIDRYRRGGAAVWIDEFNLDGSWKSGTFLGGTYNKFVGIKEYAYTPPAGVDSISIVLYTEAGSRLTAYFDDVSLTMK